MLYKLFKNIIARLEPLYGVGEANAIARRLLEDGYGLTRRDLMLNPEMELTDDIVQKIQSQIRELEQERPVQYIVGFEEFLSRRFTVNESVLIPRQETEELVQLMINECSGRILDIGTGSGAIAISMALGVENSVVEAWDISSEALDVARLNAERLRAKVRFDKVDILDVEYTGEKWDVIVSNPPYVLNSEKEYMKRNVTDYEPNGALFVPDDDPLIFYKAITNFASRNLSSKGSLYFEINQKFAQEVVALLVDFENIRVIRDIHGADRMICCNAKR